MATPAYVGTTAQTFSSSASPTVAYTPAGQNRIVLAIAITATRTINSITDDSAGGPLTWTVAQNRAQTSQVALYYSSVIPAPVVGTSVTITVNFSSGATGSLDPIEISGTSATSPLDSASGSDNSATGTMICAAAGAIDTTTDVICLAVIRPTATNGTWTNSFTRINGALNTHWLGYKTSAAALTDENCSTTVAGTKTGPGIIASFTAGAAAAGAGPIFDGRAFGEGRIFGGSALC